jgi:hypothetical protein
LATSNGVSFMFLSPSLSEYYRNSAKGLVILINMYFSTQYSQQLYPTFSHLVNSNLAPCCLFLDARLMQPEVMSMRHIVAGPLNTCGRGPPEKKIKKLELACLRLIYFRFFIWGCGALGQGAVRNYTSLTSSITGGR